MSLPRDGGCRCGAVRYRMNAEPFVVAHCHCRDCQYSTGGGSAVVMIAPRDGVEVTQGETTAYRVEAENGNFVTRSFCGTCGTPLFSDLSGNPALYGVKVGTLDDPSAVTPAVHAWTVSAPAWSLPDDGLPRFERNPQG
ncbi:MAG: GFA family protein [Myxococcota bacterium]